MELKYQNLNDIEGTPVRFNRTFMELKLLVLIVLLHALIGLIVPLWN